MANACRKKLARVLVTGSAAVVLALAGPGVAMAAGGQDELPPLPTNPDCPGSPDCIPADAPGVRPLPPS